MSKQEEIINIIAEQVGMDADKVTLTSTFVEDLRMDSLDRTQLLMTLEDKYGTYLPPDPTQLRTVGDVIKIIEEGSLSPKA